MIKKLILILVLVFSVACSQSGDIPHKKPISQVNKSSSSFYYSDQFSKHYKVKNGKKVNEWKDLLAVGMERKPANGYDACILKLYLGTEINYDYPTQDNFINIMGDRFDDIFSYVSEVTDEDARVHAQLAFQSANSIIIEGFKGNKSDAIAGFNIDYVMKDAASEMNFIKTLAAPCDVLDFNHNNYYLLLKPEGINKVEEFLKFPLPLKKNNGI